MRTWWRLGRRWGAAVAGAGTVATSWACLWDYDTVRAEARFHPEVLAAVAGRFEVYPAKYYELRLERSSKRVAGDAGLLDDYDACATASDKLGRSDDAIAWMRRKASAINAAKLPPGHAHRYRYHANLGTMLAHKFLRDGPEAEPKLLDESIAELRKALQIDPDAHFGREIVQLKAIEALRSLRTGEDEAEGFVRQWIGFCEKVGRKKVQEGIIGMMAFGGTWDSADLSGLLYLSMSGDDGMMAAQIRRRYDRQSQAHRPILVTPDVLEEMRMLAPAEPGPSDRAFAMLDANGETFRAHVAEHVRGRLDAGRHPDWDPTFWAGYEPVPPVDVRKLPGGFSVTHGNAPYVIGAVAAAVAGSATLMVWYVRRRRGRVA